MGRRQTFGLIAATALLLAGLFQNCGAGSSATVSSSQIGRQLEPTAPPKKTITSPSFKAGDKFEEAQLPYSPGSGLLNKIKANYKLYTGYKALAMARNGYGAMAIDPAITSQEEANILAQERCQLFSGNLPCAVVVEGNKFKYSESILLQNHSMILESGSRGFNAMTIPGLAFIWRQKEAGLEEGYLKRTNRFKAFAIGPNGAGAAGWSEANQAEAIRRAYEFCENIIDQACTLYAIDDEVVFNVTSFAMSSDMHIKYGPRAFTASLVPYVSDADRVALAEVSRRVSNGEHAVVALSRYGQYYISYATELSPELEATALLACNAQVKDSDYDCFIYSKDLSVLFTRKILVAANH